MVMEVEVASRGELLKVGVFVLVQALVYLILAQSSAVFSRTKSLGLRAPARSASSRRLLELLSDLPFGAGDGELYMSRVAAAGKGDLSPVPADRKKTKDD